MSRPRRGYKLTDREIEMASYVYRGMSNREISKMMGNNPGSVRGNLRNVYNKLGLSGDGARVGLAVWVARQVKDTGDWS